MYEPKANQSRLPLHFIGCDHPLDVLIRGTDLWRILWDYKNPSPPSTVDQATTFTSVIMATDYYGFPPSRPYPGWGPGPNTPIEPVLTHSSAVPVVDKLQALEISTPIQKTYKTFLQWRADAQATTAEYQRNGFPSPVAWVYVEGHAIPPNAIIGGVDRRGPWHIARAFYEGSMELGKAGRHLRLGACISYHGKEREVDKYEVLVEANLPTRWVYQPLPPLGSTTTGSAAAGSRLTLADFKLVVIVDDSDSMDASLWPEARDALAGVAELSRLKGGEGLDIYCLNSPHYRIDLRGETEVRDFFDDIIPEGQTPTGAKLREILDIYVPRIEDTTLNHKPISILVITDGVPTDDPRSVIVEFARRLDVKNIPLRQLGIQFVQIGDDPEATAALKELDDNLGPAHGVRDMVDATPFNQAQPQLSADIIVKLVLGSINSTLDNRDILSPSLLD